VPDVREKLTVAPLTGLPKRSLTVALATPPVSERATVRASAATVTKLTFVVTVFVPAVAVIVTVEGATQPAM